MDIQHSLQKDLDSVASWCSYNNMLIHPVKSKCMVIAPRNKSKHNQPLTLHINSVALDQVTSHPSCSWYYY